MPSLLSGTCISLTKCIHHAIELTVYANENGSASGIFYADDGLSLKYMTDNDSAMVNFSYDQVAGLTGVRADNSGSYKFPAT